MVIFEVILKKNPIKYPISEDITIKNSPDRNDETKINLYKTLKYILSLF